MHSILAGRGREGHRLGRWEQKSSIFPSVLSVLLTILYLKTGTLTHRRKDRNGNEENSSKHKRVPHTKGVACLTDSNQHKKDWKKKKIRPHLLNNLKNLVAWSGWPSCSEKGKKLVKESMPGAGGKVIHPRIASSSPLGETKQEQQTTKPTFARLQSAMAQLQWTWNWLNWELYCDTSRSLTHAHTHCLLSVDWSPPRKKVRQGAKNRQNGTSDTFLFTLLQPLRGYIRKVMARKQE